jgi:hypothetical protein
MILEDAVPLLEKFSALNTQAISIQSMSSSSDMSALLSESIEKTVLANQVLVIFAKFILIFLILWIIFQGFNWFLAARCVKGKIETKRFFLNFSIVSFIWLILTILGSIFIFKIVLNNLLNPNNIMNNLVINIISVLLVSVLLYFSLISYSIASRYNLKEFLKNIFILGIKDFKNIIIAYILLVIFFIIANYLMQLVANISSSAVFICGLIIVMPLIAFSRVYLTNTLEK